MRLSLLWHFHQPLYRHAETREYLLPWVLFHTTKNYHQMALIAAETEFPCAFNFVPCLLEQIADYAEGRVDDRLLKAIRKRPGDLTPDDKELLRKLAPDEQRSDRLQIEALRACFNPLTASRGDKDELLEIQENTLRGVIPLVRDLGRKGTVELMTTPYYHPLLPLIFDLGAAGVEAGPGFAFRHPEDGEAQLRNGRAYFESVMGAAPAGLWPSEGGLSRDVCRAAARAGFKFAVTDENILWKSLPEPHRAEDLFRPYDCEGLTVLFRERELSDLIGFVYQKWDEREAVGDLVRRLSEKARALPEDALCVIALDGENCWEFYKENGVPFLRRLYERLRTEPGIEPVLFSRTLALPRPERPLDLVPGTWLGSFAKWSGHPAKNASWELLARVREACGPSQAVYAAEGSDWFWWAGEAEQTEFDILFHSYLDKAWRDAGLSGQPR
ncbi:MAG: glycoside hydrolase family 57 protein [Candidatus Aminicenantes bacterium]|nr:glycoside hydrolase family 57 protein [Candidatus Aminicenantes bacterium]